MQAPARFIPILWKWIQGISLLQQKYELKNKRAWKMLSPRTRKSKNTLFNAARGEREKPRENLLAVAKWYINKDPDAIEPEGEDLHFHSSCVRKFDPE